jgi:hypothetical protein
MFQNQIENGNQDGEKKKMNKLLFVLPIIASVSLYSSNEYVGSTTAAVTLAGGIVKAKQVDKVEKKYKRKDCPVCKGKGWYISGDNISKVPCGYCEPESSSEVTHPPVVIKPDCKTQVIKK